MGGEERKSKMYIAGVIALYWSVSISLVYINKFIVSGQQSKSDGGDEVEEAPSLPIFITWSQVRVRVKRVSIVSPHERERQSTIVSQIVLLVLLVV